VVHTFTISNNGDAELALTGTPVVVLATGTHFSVSQQPDSSTVAGGSVVNFQITFDPQSTGTFSDTVIIENNDSDENPYTFMITGDGEYINIFFFPLILKW
jgi:hypothetical protein